MQSVLKLLYRVHRVQVKIRKRSSKQRMHEVGLNRDEISAMTATITNTVSGTIARIHTTEWLQFEWNAARLLAFEAARFQCTCKKLCQYAFQDRHLNAA